MENQFLNCCFHKGVRRVFFQITFILSAVLTIVSAILVATTRHIMHACVYLLGTLIGVAGLYLTLGADLVAATQLTVYVGGVVILMVFAVMLTGGQDFIKHIKHSMLSAPFMGNIKTYFVGLFSAAVLGFVIFHLLSNVVGRYRPTPFVDEVFRSSLERIGTDLVTTHILAFEIASVLLLGAMVGAAIIARPKKM